MNRLSRRAVPAGATLLTAVTVLLLIPSSALAFPPERWYKLIDSGFGNDVGYGVAIDSDGNVLAVGYAASTADHGRNGYVVKYSPTGTVLCDFEVDSGPVGGTGGVASDDRLLGVAVDSEDNFVVVGTLSGTYPPAAQAAFINKYDAGCSPVWDHPIVYTDRPNDSAWNSAYDVTIDGEDHIYVGGECSAAGAAPKGNGRCGSSTRTATSRPDSRSSTTI